MNLSLYLLCYSCSLYRTNVLCVDINDNVAIKKTLNSRFVNDSPSPCTCIYKCRQYETDEQNRCYTQYSYMYAIKYYSDDRYSTPADLRRPLSNILIRLSSFEPAGGIVQAASLNCSVTKRHVAWSRNCRCADVRSHVDNDSHGFVQLKTSTRLCPSEVANFSDLDRWSLKSRSAVIHYCKICIYLLRGSSSGRKFWCSRRIASELCSCAISFYTLTCVLIHWKLYISMRDRSI